MGAYLGVQQGSAHDPAFVHVSYIPESHSEKPKKRIVLVGKGLTFDSGGYNLKVGNSSIEMMKMDMGGAAAVFGAAQAIAQLKPEVIFNLYDSMRKNVILHLICVFLFSRMLKFTSYLPYVRI